MYREGGDRRVGEGGVVAVWSVDMTFLSCGHVSL